ncbi:helix-turn-helix transcriptional regulator [Sphingopyxis macrogoltabida]|uniref:DNA-binding protein n=1 Tax=Sphingopyxis macrogoltabida TaxID=33050 RepID=A0A0N9UMX1_SPHMC|nr:YafY family protein [Sphingopyxis macrogoltabida]ALH81127.1 DNA-binding protein [Sphingopyxis macrogoltabida]
MRRAERLFQIIQILRRSHRPVTGAVLAAELEVSIRTVYRDMADLIGQRVPITGEPGFGYLLAAEYDMPPLMLTPDEIEAVVLGSQWVAERGDPLLSRAASDVIAKIAAVVPDHLRPFIEDPGVAAKPKLHREDDPGSGIDIAPLRKAIREGRKLRLGYRSVGGERTERTVWPVVLGFSEAERLLIAWCELRRDFRHFRTDRMTDAEMLDEAIGIGSKELRLRWQGWRATQIAGHVGSVTK